MIVAVPEQETVWVSGLGTPEHRSMLTWYRWWCSMCRISSPLARASHAELALRQGDHHAEREQCHVVGQLELFAVAGGGR